MLQQKVMNVLLNFQTSLDYVSYIISNIHILLSNYPISNKEYGKTLKYNQAMIVMFSAFYNNFINNYSMLLRISIVFSPIFPIKS